MQWPHLHELKLLLLVSGRRQSETFPTHKNEEQQAEPGNSLALLLFTLSTTRVASANLTLCLCHCALGLYQHLHLSPFHPPVSLLFSSPYCGSGKDENILVYKPGLSISFSSQYSYPHPYSIQPQPISPFTL